MFFKLIDKIFFIIVGFILYNFSIINLFWFSCFELLILFIFISWGLFNDKYKSNILDTIKLDTIFISSLLVAIGDSLGKSLLYKLGIIALVFTTLLNVSLKKNDTSK